MLIGFEAFPIDVARVHARHDKLPLGPGNLDGFRAAVWHMARACAAIHESPCVSWIVQHLHNARVPRRRPQQVTLVGARAQPAGEQQALPEKVTNGLHGASGTIESIEHQLKRFLHLDIRIQTDRPIIAVHQTDGRPHLQFATASFVELPAAHSCLDDMRFGFTHCAFQAEHETIIEVGRIVKAVFVGEQRCRHPAQLDEAMPLR
jgi:hypothetical protein